MPDREPAPIPLRPRHVLCAIGLRGAEDAVPMHYGPSMAVNLTRMVREQLEGPEGGARRVRIVAGADVVCVSCGYRDGADCRMIERATRIDAAHAGALAIAPGETLRWRDLRERARARVRPGDLDALCRGCPMLPADLCKRALAALNAGGPARISPPTPPAPPRSP